MNEDTSGNVLQLQAEIKKLRDALERYKGITLVAMLLRLATLSTVGYCLLFSAGMAPPPHSPSRGDVALFGSPGGFVGHSDDEKTIQELREMLENSMNSRDRAEAEKTVSTLIVHVHACTCR